MKNITLNKLHNLLAESFAVCVNDTLYFVGYNIDDTPYIADNDGYDRIELDEVDGDIEVTTETGVFFYISGDPIEMKFLGILPVKD